MSVIETIKTFCEQLDKQYQSSTSIQASYLDTSVNFIIQREVGFSEARFVQREKEEIIVYLSSQTGCKQACRFCHLTQSKQTKLSDETLQEYQQQAQIVLRYYSLLVEQQLISPASFVNFNFMSRGELFANNIFLNNSEDIFNMLVSEALDNNLFPRFKCSTIMPKEIEQVDFYELFPRTSPDIYYSLYSLNPEWRKRWMPKALDPDTALNKLARWQKFSRKIPVIHFALIEEGKTYDNSSEENISEISNAIKHNNLHVDINIVKYNPANPKLGKEPETEVLQRVCQQFSEQLPSSRVQLVGRVGYDVKASCGMFVYDEDSKTNISLDGDKQSSSSKILLPLINNI